MKYLLRGLASYGLPVGLCVSFVVGKNGVYDEKGKERGQIKLLVNALVVW